MGNKNNGNIFTYEDCLNKEEFKKGFPVFLNIYDLNCVNYLLEIFGLGIYHSTIEVHSKEYCFGPTTEDEPGFFINEPGELLSKLNLKEKRYLGNTLYNEKELIKLLSLESPYWMGRTYDPFVKNCNHFSYYISKILVNEENLDFPIYINRICFFGKFVSCFYPPIKRLYGNLQKRITHQIRIYNNNSEPNDVNNIKKQISKENSENTKINKLNKENNNNDSNDITDYNNSKRLSKSYEYFSNEKNINDITNIEKEIYESTTEDFFKNSIDIDIDNKISDFYYNILFVIQHNDFLRSDNYNLILDNSKAININIKQFLKLLKEINEKIEKEFKLIGLEKENKNNSKIHKFNVKKIKAKYNKKDKIVNDILEKIKFCQKIFFEVEKYINQELKEIDFNVFINKKSFILNQIYKIDNNNIFSNYFKLKIYHMINFMNIIAKKFEDENTENDLDHILKIDQDDFYANYSLAYFRFNQMRLPECSELLYNLKKQNEKNENHFYINQINNFSKVIQNII